MQANLGTRIVAIALVSVAYVLGTHWLMTRAHESPWNVVGVLSPMLLAVAVGAWKAGQRWLGAGAALLVVALCAQALLGINVSPQVLYLAQHVGINLFLAIGFGSTLRAGQTSLITILASRVHRYMPPPMVAYTRNVTLAWTIYFVVISGASVVVYLTASFDDWAFFANLLSPVTVALMFAGEYLLRYRLHPEFERTSIADAIRSYMGGTAAQGTTTQAPGDTLR
jgi:uncharacterized membrane protein